MQYRKLSLLAAVWLLTRAGPGLADEGGSLSAPPAENELATAQLERQVRYLSAALAAAWNEADAARAQTEGRALSAAAAEGAAPAALAGGARIREVSRELGLVVADAGSRQGIRAGLTLTVIRGERPLARVRVVDVRRRLAGAVIEELLAGAPYPGPGDRLVVVTDGE